MPSVAVLDMTGKKVEDMNLSDNIFGAEVNKTVLHMAVVNYLANQRQGTQSTLTRAEVRGGGAKPWRQKGTGRARQGSTRAPQWIHGGIALGPKPRDYSYSLTKKTKRVALKSALSAKVEAGELIIIDNISFDEIKTSKMAKMLEDVSACGKVLVVMPEVDEKVIKSARNIKGVKTALVNTINVYDILNSSKMVASKEAILKIEEVYA
ncbi:MAG: 50S ribosomal protein L4 [Clostridia bacterium]|nr:50S ribosomal protein L4 [Clostridia bacterium]